MAGVEAPSEEMVKHFREICEAKEAGFAKCPPEAMAKMCARNREEAKAEYDQYWAEADTNGDGCLNHEEWVAYTKIMYASSLKNYGWTAEHDEELMHKIYKVLVEWTPNENGVSKEAMIPFMIVGQMVRNEIRAKKEEGAPGASSVASESTTWHWDIVGHREPKKMPHQSQEGFDFERRFCPRDIDIIISTFPKAGNTLLSQLAHQLRCPGDESYDDMYEVVPFIEFLWASGVDDMTDSSHRFNDFIPRLFKDHKYLSGTNAGGRYVAVFRDPLKTYISLYSFMQAMGFIGADIDIDSFITSDGSVAEDMFWGANIWMYYIDQWRCRLCENVFLLCFEDLTDDFDTQAEALARFMGLRTPLSMEHLEQVREKCSRDYMMTHVTKFDESLTYERMEAIGRWSTPFKPAPRVTSGEHQAKVTVRESTVEFLEAKWKHYLGQEFGLEDYASLRAALGELRKIRH